MGRTAEMGYYCLTKEERKSIARAKGMIETIRLLLESIDSDNVTDKKDRTKINNSIELLKLTEASIEV